MAIPAITPNQLMEKYQTILLDAFGVLVYQYAAMPGAVEFIATLNHQNQSYYVLTNDAAHSIPSSVARFRKFGFLIPEDRIITSGSLIAHYFAANHLAGHGCAVLGTLDSCQYVRDAGGIVVPIQNDRDWDVLVVCDEMGYPFLEYVEAALSGLFHKYDHQENVHLLLPNPDLIYRKNEEQFGITAGSAALVLETGLRLRYPQRDDLRFNRLGKPYRPIFEEAYRRSGTKNMVMVGDQLAYDIRGGRDFGIDTVLIGTGITHVSALPENTPDCPTYWMKGWSEETNHEL